MDGLSAAVTNPSGSWAQLSSFSMQYICTCMCSILSLGSVVESRHRFAPLLCNLFGIANFKVDNVVSVDKIIDISMQTIMS